MPATDAGDDGPGELWFAVQLDLLPPDTPYAATISASSTFLYELRDASRED